MLPDIPSMDDNHQTDPGIREIVRRYSVIVAEEKPDDTLSQALEANARHEIAEEEWKREGGWLPWLLSSHGCHNYDDPSLIRLEENKTRVTEKWKSFHSDHPDLQLGDISHEDLGPPRLDALLRAAQDAEAAWEKNKESGVGKTKSAIENFMGTMNSHSYLFSVIPSDGKYTSLITGVLTSVTKAFVNHKKTAELFSESLESISKDLATVEKSVMTADPVQIKTNVVDLYVAVFDFLCGALEWFGGGRRRRLIKSFRQDYTDDIRKNTEKVKDVISRIRVLATQATQSRVQNMDLGVKDIHHEMKSMSNRLGNIEELLESAAGKNRENPAASTAAFGKLGDSFILILGQNAMKSLVATGEAEQDRRMNQFLNTLAIQGRKSPLYRHITSIDGATEEQYEDDSEEMSETPMYTRADIQEASGPFLKQYFEDGRSDVLKLGSSASKSSLPSEVAQKITKWIAHPTPSFLWVEGPASYTPAERQLSVIAVLLCSSALEGENPIPCVSFTPKPTYDTSSDRSMSRQEKVLIVMLYSIAGQLIQLLPETLEPITTEQKTLDPQIFERLDGTLSSASIALDLIETLLSYGPPTLMLILNRLQVTECPTTTSHLQRLVKLLKAYDPEHIIKVLFITQGGSPALTATLDMMTEKISARRMTQARPGQPLKGWSSLGHLNASSSFSSGRTS